MYHHEDAYNAWANETLFSDLYVEEQNVEKISEKAESKSEKYLSFKIKNKNLI